MSEMVFYNGRAVPEKGFRTFIYGPDGSERLVESWDEFKDCIASGCWFSTKQECGSEVILDEEPKIIEEIAQNVQKESKSRKKGAK